MTTNNDDENYGPDIQEMNIRWDKIAKDHETCLIVEFHITKLGAQSMIEEWEAANNGDLEAQRNSMENYDYIVASLEEQIYD